MKLEMWTQTDAVTGDILVGIKIPQHLTRTDGEFKWRIIQAVTLALTEKEAQYGGHDTEEGLAALLQLSKRTSGAS